MQRLLGRYNATIKDRVKYSKSSNLLTVYYQFVIPWISPVVIFYWITELFQLQLIHRNSIIAILGVIALFGSIYVCVKILNYNASRDTGA